LKHGRKDGSSFKQPKATDEKARLPNFAIVDDISPKRYDESLQIEKKVQRNHCKYESCIVEVDLITILPYQFYNYEWYIQELLGNNAIEILSMKVVRMDKTNILRLMINRF
jgi:hypothetical protein